MGFSITITVLTLLGLLFCFRRASMLLPRNLSIQLQMFGQDNNNSNARGPIALTDDDMTGATGLDWEDLEAQLHNEEDVEELEDIQPLRQRQEGRTQRPVTKRVRYADEDADEDAAKPLTSSSGLGGAYTDDNDESEDDGGHSTAPYRVEVEEERVPTTKKPERTELQEARTDSDETLLQEETTQKDDLFKLDDTDSELEV
ncbi:hypothetical protein BGZ72_008344 [Mortierella alpina]|nr:hypothetical protein BGZ72_008344 [Mortierella alpina]